jgi:hypothetical protein
MVKLLEQLYQTNEISEEVKNLILDKYFNK